MAVFRKFKTVNDHTLASGLKIVSFGLIRKLGKGMLPEKFQQ